MAPVGLTRAAQPDRKAGVVTVTKFWPETGIKWPAARVRKLDAELDRLGRLIGAGDMRGFLHCHTNYSDGTSTIEDWAKAGEAAGYDYVGITDHSGAAMYAGGLYPEAVGQQHVAAQGALLHRADAEQGGARARVA